MMYIQSEIFEFLDIYNAYKILTFEHLIRIYFSFVVIVELQQKSVSNKKSYKKVQDFIILKYQQKNPKL